MENKNNIARIKYPRTLHLPWSLGRSDDDKVHNSLEQFKGMEIVVTEKMDGENTTFYADGSTHARSIAGRSHESRAWMKQFAAHVGHKLPGNDIRVCGENLFARHSIEYNLLPTYFLGFSVWAGDTCLSWDDTTELCLEVGVCTVRVMYRGIFDEDLLQDMSLVCEANKDRIEGYVIRPAKSFKFDEFGKLVGKYVRKDHVTSDTHWMNQEVVKNGAGVWVGAINFDGDERE